MMSVKEEKECIQMTVLEESRDPQPSKGAADAEKHGSETLRLHSGRSAGVLDRCTRPSYKYWQYLRFALLSVVVVIVVLLLLLPTVLYHLLPLPQKNAADGNHSNMSCNQTTSLCSERVAVTDGFCSPNVIYSQVACQGSLLALQGCLPGRQHSSDVHVSTTNQEEMEMQANQLLDGLSVLNPSPECRAVIQPFLCLYLFGLCSSNGVAYQPSFEECVYISRDACTSEWIKLNNFLMMVEMPTLPDCTSFPNTFSAITGSGSGGQDIEPPPMGRLSVQVNCSTLQCQEGFSCSAMGNTSLCLPVCGGWEQYPHNAVVGIDVAVIVSASIGLVASIAVLVISCIRWKHMFTFPSVFVVYLTVTLMINAVFYLITQIDRTSLYCASEYLIVIEAGEIRLVDPTPYCTLSGCVFYYGIFQLTVWWFCHVVSLFWKIRFPFHTRSFGTAHRVKYIHIAMVTVGLVLPALPVIVTFTAGDPSMRGFGLTSFPPTNCDSLQMDPIFYSLVLPINLILVTGIPMLIIIFWVIHKQHGLLKARKSKHPFKISTAERKILIVFCYYALLTVISLTGLSIFIRNAELFEDTIREYWQCEATGVDPGNPCNRASFEEMTDPGLIAFAQIILWIFPAVNLIFVVNISNLKQIWCGQAAVSQ